MADLFEVEFDEDGKLIDFLSGTSLVRTPEELVRQKYLRILHHEYKFPKAFMRREVAIQRGSDVLKDISGNIIRADIMVYANKAAAEANNQGQILFIVECKAPSETEGYNQLVSYIYNTSAEGGVWYNGSGKTDEARYYRRFSSPNSLKPWIGIPRHTETWDAIGRRRKADLLKPKDVKGLLRRCHNRLHGRGVDGDEEDLTMDMVRIILAKAMDEEQPGELPSFYCTTDEYQTTAGVQTVSDRIQTLFDEVKRANPDVFTSHEHITVGPRAIADVVVELQEYRLLSDAGAGVEWDIMGHAYEQYTSVYLKREKGQFFTNRLVIDAAVRIINPDHTDLILDPAGGSGGFLTGAMRYVRTKITSSDDAPVAKSRQLDRHRKNLFLVEINRRLTKVAKTAMILNGDGHTGITTGDSLGDYSKFDVAVKARADRGMPTIIFTNPPFAGVGDGRVTQEETLRRFSVGHRWAVGSNGKYGPTEDLIGEGAPPELLFVERCIDWLAPGGRLGIVLPKSFLDTATYRPGREIIFRSCRLRAVITLHKNTFQPHTGVRTCLLIVEKLKAGEKAGDDYPIFMAISRKVGQDSEGVPILKRDPTGALLEDLDEDLSDISARFEDFRLGSLKPSGYVFSTSRSSLDEELRINPQLFLPHLNETLENIERIDSLPGWSAITMGHISKDIKIFKGPRFKSENLIVEHQEDAVTLERYYTPSSMLQDKSDSVKFLDISRANASQAAVIKAIRVKRGDIVITRSGSIGRIAYVTARFDGAIVSDDLIRVRTDDLDLQHYLFAYLQSQSAQDQMLRNEYGAIQQHLEPIHVRNLLVPWPEDRSEVADMIEAGRRLVEAREAMDARNTEARAALGAGIKALVDAAKIATKGGDQAS
ncbi:N-6 DNA methylase [Brevundimonas aveniformis]|uniref:N-6 DNA methylase n=1 Tax=Brevundimonas aveniformis TaxID=370977 RepID=UPI0024935989|nr:N-6 DNA methylase [Brevundimonas aveniformis]